MYLGSTDEDGFHHLVWEIIDNALDEYLAGYCKKIKVTLKSPNIIIIEDDGRGIPPGIHSKTKVSTIETVFTYLHAGGKFDAQTYQVSGGLHGVGSTVVNAMSRYLKAEVFRGKEKYTVTFTNGLRDGDGLITSENTERKKSGTRIEFSPNLEMFDDYYEFKAEKITKRLKQTSFINEKIRLEFHNKITDESETFYHENGIQEYLMELVTPSMLLNQHKTAIFGIAEKEKTTLKFIFRYVNQYNFQKIHSFCNNIQTSEGGTHEKGFRMAICNVTKKLMKKFNFYNDLKEPLESVDILQGLLAIIVVLHPDPKFAGQTKTKLVNSETAPLIYKITANLYEKFLLENPQERQLIFRKIISSLQMRVAISRKIQEIREKDKFFETSTLPGKLADCSITEPADRELFIVEGDSAGGSAKLGRDRRFQAILPLKGKIINSEKATQTRLFNNQEVNDLVISLGFSLKGERINQILEKQNNQMMPIPIIEEPSTSTNTEENTKTEEENKNEEMALLLKKLRYHKVIIMTDADVDGSHIAVLLLTFLYRFFPELLENKFVYLAQPPLFKLKVGKKSTYFYDEADLKKHLESVTSKYEIQRYKGLGEMNPGQLWETTMNPENRILKQIEVDDVESTLAIFQLLMGKEVEGRKKFIVDNALFVSDLDV